MSERYKTEQDFRRALEQRLVTQAQRGGRGLVRERQVLVFERFLARAVATEMNVVVKGGMALELRTAQARSTRDIDLRALGAPERFERALHDLGQTEAGDYLRFRVDLHARPEVESLGMKYPGKRYKVQALLAGKVYADPFGVDVSFGEPMLGPAEHVKGRADLSFIGLEPAEFSIYPRATHIAEKLHAYSLPRPTPNSRVRDLPDMAILASVGPIEAEEVRSALEQTFAHRATHALPAHFPAVPARWAEPYAELAEANRLPWRDLVSVERAATAFLDPVLHGERLLWDPGSWSWPPVPRSAVVDRVFEYESMFVRGATPVVRLRAPDGTLTEHAISSFGQENVGSGDRVRLTPAGALELVTRGVDRGRSR